MSNTKSYTPPIEVKNNASAALKYREKQPPSQRAMTPVGVARARDLSNGRPQSLETIQRMKAFFDRHAVDKKSANYGVGSKGWQAWMGWGGDAGRRWVERVLAEELKDESTVKKTTPALAATPTPAPQPKPVVAPAKPEPQEEKAEPEGGMAIGQLRSIAQKTSMLSNMLTPDTELEPWVASLLSVAEYQISAIYDYLNFSGEGGETLTAATNAEAKKGVGMQKTLNRKSDVIEKSLTSTIAKRQTDTVLEELEDTVTADNEAFAKFATFEKAAPDQRIVVGYASSERIDGQNDIVDSEALHQALDDYMQWANLREMHQPKAVGKVLQATPVKGKIRLSDGTVLINPLRIIAKIVDEDAWSKVKSGVLKGFSIGGKVVNAVTQKINGKDIRRITGLTLNEISLVDRPANPDARIVMMKRDWALDQDSIEKMVKGGKVDDLILKAKEANPADILPMIQSLRNQAEIQGDLDTAERYNEVITLFLEAMGVIPSGTVRDIDDMEDADLDNDEPEDTVDMETLYGSGDGEEKAQKRRNTLMYGASNDDLEKIGRAISKNNMDTLADILTAANIIRTLCAKLGIEIKEEQAGEGESEHAHEASEGEAIKPVATAVEITAVKPVASAADAVLEAIENAPKKMMPGNNTGVPIHTPMNPNAPAQNVTGGYPIQRNAQNGDLQKAEDAPAVDITGLEKEMQSMEETIDNAAPAPEASETVEETPVAETAKVDAPAVPQIDVASALQDVIAKSLSAALAGTAAQLDTVVKAVERIETKSSEQSTAVWDALKPLSEAVDATKGMVEPLVEKVQALESIADQVKSLSERIESMENQPVGGNAPVLRGSTVNKAIGMTNESGEPADEVQTLYKMLDDTQDPLVRTKLRERLAHLETKRALFGR